MDKKSILENSQILNYFTEFKQLRPKSDVCVNILDTIKRTLQ